VTAINDEQQKLKDRIFQLTSKQVCDNVEIVTNIPDFMNVNTGQVYRLQGKNLLIRGDMYELRFGIRDQPKFWVKRAIDLETGSNKIIKFTFNEEFISHIGPLRIRCFRNPDKESDVLNLVKGDSRFMQGTTMEDEGGNSVRLIDFIEGETLYAYIIESTLSHEAYYFERVPWILRNLIKCYEAIKFLHNNNFCHGDVRNDHILIERKTDEFRWIDFDLQQYYLDFDLWSLGNVLSFILGKGIRSFYEAYKTDYYPKSVRDSLSKGDASAFYNYRIMNLKKLFPYVSKKLNDILLHFTVDTNIFYENIESMIDDLNDAVSELPFDDKVVK
jgi:serine/threonine protein kinase